MTQTAKEIRKTILQIANRAKSPHIGSALGCVDILSALYFKVLNLQDYETRDIFILSKAHAAMALYATLYHRGLMNKQMLLGYYQNGGTLPAHTDRNSHAYIEISAGSLGHGLPIGIGMAIAFKKSKEDRKRNVYILMGDGEIQEGSIWEAAMLGAKLKLDNIVVFIDRNDLQGYGRASELVEFEPLEDKWKAFGWDCIRVDGHCEEKIVEVVTNKRNRPLCVICDTIKGKGVEFMEDKLEWHYYLVTDEIYSKALEVLK
ncbi:transketolase [Helicobacter colisuis]|uniref:Transketolase n=1 Tax=Helicobacter colisuis TaxID=2949739 RepID=A0ABT0TUJ9_9HELI|nr:transketolase [Helicobacter colisuis]MCL9819133.1 transketolase [Helicobacter colisuis]